MDWVVGVMRMLVVDGFGGVFVFWVGDVGGWVIGFSTEYHSVVQRMEVGDGWLVGVGVGGGGRGVVGGLVF